MAGRYGLEIRAATGADAAGVSELLHAAGYPVAPDLLATSHLAGTLDALRRSDGAALLALEWGPPSGLVLLHWYRSLDASLPIAQITSLIVGPDERRRGIGRLLVKAAAQAARSAGCGTMEIRIAPEQPALRAFAEATGFSDHGGVSVRPLRKKG